MCVLVCVLVCVSVCVCARARARGRVRVYVCFVALVLLVAVCMFVFFVLGLFLSFFNHLNVCLPVWPDTPYHQRTGAGYVWTRHLGKGSVSSLYRRHYS